MDSISSTLSRAPAASSSAAKKRPASLAKAKSLKNPPTFAEVSSLHEATCELLDSLAGMPSDQSPKCNAICWEVAAQFPAIPLSGAGQGECVLAQAKLEGLLGDRSDATEAHKALIEKITPRIDTLFDWLDWMPSRVQKTSEQQRQHDMTGVLLAADLIKQGEKLQGSDGSFFSREYRANGAELNNYALSAINLVIAHPEIAHGFAAVLSSHFAFEGGTPDVDACYLNRGHSEIFGPGTWTGADVADESVNATLEGVEDLNPFLGPKGRDLARNCSYEIEQLMKILIEKTDRDENGPLIRALAARTHTVNSVIIGYLGEDEGESLEDRHWDVYRTAMVTE